MGIPIIQTITIMGITLTATFRSIMISMTFIISIMMATLTVTLVVVALAVILMVGTAVVVMAGEDVRDCQRKGRAESKEAERIGNRLLRIFSLSVSISQGDPTEIFLDF